MPDIQYRTVRKISGNEKLMEFLMLFHNLQKKPFDLRSKLSIRLREFGLILFLCAKLLRGDQSRKYNRNSGLPYAVKKSVRTS